MFIPPIRSNSFAVAFTVALSTLLLPAAGAQQTQRYTLSGTDVAIYNLVGAIHVEGSSGSETTVEVTRQGSEGGKLTVERGRVRDAEALRVVYPSDRILFRDPRNGSRGRTTVDVRDDGTFGSDGDRWGRGRVEIVSSGSGLDASAELRVSLPRGKKLSIYLAAGDATLSNTDGDISVNVFAASLTTNHTRGSLDLDTGSGEVRITDAEGEVDLDSGSGEVIVAKVHGGLLRVDSGSGSVQVSDVGVDRLDIDSGSGSVDLRGVAAPDISLDSGSGSVGLQLLDDVASMRIDSGSGNVTLTIPESLGAELTAETGSGGIDFDFPVTMLKRESDYMRVRLGDGRGKIAIDGGSGSIRVRHSRG